MKSNRFLLANVFGSDARLEGDDRFGHLGFPGVTVGLDGIEDVFVRRFNQAYKNVHFCCLDRPRRTAGADRCDWLVVMTDKESRNSRLECGRYEWRLQVTQTCE